MNLLEVVSRALERLQPDGRRWLVALSGGADSVAALRLLLELARERGDEVTAAHLDHRLREESAADARFVAELCAEHGVELKTVVVDVAQVAADRRWNLEEAARRVRYSFLHETAREHGSSGIVVAHTLDDQAETFLRQALRGSAFPAGMPARRGLVVRPLLEVTRTALRAYLRGLPQTWREDASNVDVAGQERAWLRHSVLPLLQERYPHAPAHLARTAAGLGEARDAVDDLARRLYGRGPLNIAAVARAPAAVQRAAIAGMLARAGVEPGFDLIEDARGALKRPGRPWRRSLARGRLLRAAYGRLAVVEKRSAVLSRPLVVSDPASVAASVERLGGDPAGLPEAAALADVRGELRLRHRSDGDRMRLAGGGRLLSDLLIDLKVPREERDALLLLEGGGRILWLEGVGAASGFAGAGGPALGVRETSGGFAADRSWMRLALEQAAAAAAAGELPVGAVVVSGGELLAAAHNRTREENDPSAHAELLALRAAATKSGDWRLAGATMYVTLEPCPMCFGAIMQTRLTRVVYGADNVREGALGSVVDLRVGEWKHAPDVIGGVLAEASSRLLKAFFAALRG